MPIIAPDVAPQPIPGVRETSVANETTFGGGPGLDKINHEVQKVASDVADISIVARARQDQMAVEDAQAKATRLTTDVLYDPQTGVLTSRGTTALQAHKDGMKRLQKGMNDISRDLNGEAQIGTFNRWAMAQAEASNTTMMGHVDKELKDHDVKTYDSLLANQQGLVAMAHGNPQTLKLGFDTVNENAVAFAERNRLDPDQTKQFIQDANDKMHASVVDGMLKFQDDDSADKYFQANKDLMSPAMQEKVSVALEEGNLRNRSARESASIWDATRGNLTASFAKADKIDNPELREMTRQRLRQLSSDKNAAQDADQNDKFQQAWGLVKNASMSGSPVVLRDTVPPMLWTQLLPSNQEILKKLAFNNETNAQKWTEFSLMPPTMMKGITAQEMQQTWLPEFAPKDRDKAMSMWQKAQSNSTDSYLNATQNHMIAQSARTMNVAGLTPGDPNKAKHDPKKLRGDAAKEYVEWQNVAQQAITNFEVTKLGGTRKATQEETQTILDNLVLEKMGQKSFLGFKWGGTPVIRTPYDEIPEADKQKMESFAKKRGVKLTPDQYQTAYFYLQQKDKARAIKVLSDE